MDNYFKEGDYEKLKAYYYEEVKVASDKIFEGNF